MEHIFRRAIMTAQHGFDPGEQLVHFEWLCQIIVSPGPQAMYTIAYRRMRGQNHRREQIFPGPEFAQQGDPVFVRQAAIEHHG